MVYKKTKIHNHQVVHTVSTWEYIFPSYLFVVHHSAKYNSEDNLIEDKNL